MDLSQHPLPWLRPVSSDTEVTVGVGPLYSIRSYKRIPLMSGGWPQKAILQFKAPRGEEVGICSQSVAAERHLPASPLRRQQSFIFTVVFMSSSLGVFFE
jgi:hypothetical protein